MEQPLTILIAESRDFSEDAKQILAQIGTVREMDLSRDQLVAEVADVDVLWVRLRSVIDAEIMDSAPYLRAIVSPTTGLNHIDTAAAKARNIEIISLRGQPEFLRHVRGTAEHTIALMLSLLRHLPAAVSHVRSGGWDRDLFVGSELYGKTVGIIGYGRLGRIVASYLAAFGAEILVTDVVRDLPDLPPYVGPVSLRELLMRADLITIHVDLNSSSRLLLGQSEFKLMRRGAVLINTARGEILDEHALIEALSSGVLAGAAVDVIADEHEYQHSPLIDYARTHENLLITPHIGGCTQESMRKTEIFLARELRNVAAAWSTKELAKCAE